MMRHTKTAVAVMTTLALAAAACGGDDDGATDAPAATPDGGDGTAAPGGDVRLRVLVHQNPPMVAFMEEFNSRFEAEHDGVTIDMSVVSADDLSVVTQTRLTANDVDVIDIFGFSNAVQPYMGNATPPNWQTLIEAGLLLDLTDEPFVEFYDDLSLEQAGMWEDRVYSVNLGRVSYSGMFVNLDLLDSVGLGVPETWSELVAACEAVQASNNECMTAGGADGWPIFVGTYGLFGAMFPDQEGFVEGLWTGEIKWNDPEVIELWERYQYFAQEMLEQGVTGLAHDAAIARYAAGDVAFAPTGVWQAPALEDAAPDFEWTYIPFPGSDDPADNQYLFGKYDQGWAIAAESPRREAALAYVAAFSDPDNYQEFVNAVGFLPTQPTATLDSQLGEAVAPLLDNYLVGYEQFWVAPTGAGQWADGAQGASWFQPFNEWNDATALANQAQADLGAGL